MKIYTRTRRIWNALHMLGNLKLIKQILCSSDVVREFTMTAGRRRTLFTGRRTKKEMFPESDKVVLQCDPKLQINLTAVRKGSSFFCHSLLERRKLRECWS